MSGRLLAATCLLAWLCAAAAAASNGRVPPTNSGSVKVASGLPPKRRLIRREPARACRAPQSDGPAERVLCHEVSSSHA